MTTVVRCQGERRHKRYVGELCGLEVARVSGLLLSVEALKVRREVRPGAFLARCRCGALNEVRYIALDSELQAAV